MIKIIERALQSSLWFIMITTVVFSCFIALCSAGLACDVGVNKLLTIHSHLHFSS